LTLAEIHSSRAVAQQAAREVNRARQGANLDDLLFVLGALDDLVLEAACARRGIIDGLSVRAIRGELTAPQGKAIARALAVAVSMQGSTIVHSERRMALRLLKRLVSLVDKE
jgi:hypothetical protein